MTSLRAALLSLLVLATPFLVAGWADLGHITTAEIGRRMIKGPREKAINAFTTAYEDYFPSDVSHLPYCATFMDYIKRDTNLYDSMHFMNTPYVRDGEFKPYYPGETNAISAIKESGKALFFDKSKKAQIWGKAFSVLMLIHVVGDLHQPLHAASMLSEEYKFFPPNGDLGGNNFKVTYTSEDGMEYKQIHLLYDCMGGLKCDYMPEVVDADYEKQVKNFADYVMEKHPESSFDQEFLYPSEMFSSVTKFEAAVKDWAFESYQEAVRFYEMIPPQSNGSIFVPSEKFIADLREMLIKRVAIAGYRIGHLLKNINADRIGNEFQDLTYFRVTAVVCAMLFVLAATAAYVYRQKYKDFVLLNGNTAEINTGLLNA